VRPATRFDGATQLSYSIGLSLIVPLALLRAGHLVMPWWLRGQHDYDRGVHDPSLWAAFHAYLLFAGFLPAILGLGAGFKGLARRPADVWAWVGVISNGAFSLVAVRLYSLLFHEGFFSFVLSSLPKFVDV
jgi:hypothetical protein